jgi:hypothetical protein
MTALEELCLKYSWNEIGCVPGDANLRYQLGNLRYQLFTPILKDLYENKIVYYERFMCVATLKNIKITAEKFEATAIRHITIERGENKPHPPKSWTFGAAWFAMTAKKEYFSTYGGMWLLWTDKELVKTVEELAKKKDFKAALDLTLYKGQ